MQSVHSTINVVNSNLTQARCTLLCEKVCHWLTAGWWFPLVSSGFVHE